MAEIDQTSETLILVSAKRAARILEIYGADPARWPQAERSGTLAALNEFPDLAQARRAATDLDQRLDAAPGYVPSGDLSRRISAAALHDPQPAGWRGWLAKLNPVAATPIGIIQPVATLFVAVTLGILAGAIVPGSDNDALAEEFLLLAFGPVYQIQAFEDAGGAE